MARFRTKIPTYCGQRTAKGVVLGKKKGKYRDPKAPIRISRGKKLSINLGTESCYDHRSKPSLQIERHPLGWAIQIHSDKKSLSGSVYILDDGRSLITFGEPGHKFEVVNGFPIQLHEPE